jgi:anthranilate phosphoribosyltransferase
MSEMNPATTTLSPYSVAIQLENLLARRDLTREEATELMDAIGSGRVSSAGIAAIATALRAKGESVTEIAAFARVMRSCALSVKAPAGTLDTCGTGGDKSDTFNISTATAFVVAGMGIPVAKHGGRSISSRTGSADVLKVLGVNIDANPACVERCISAAGIGFMFAPNHHPAAKNVAPVRKELGVRTIFNLLGPLSNPARAELQLLGVFEPGLCKTFAEVLNVLGSRNAMVVCGTGPGGEGHLDEVSTFGPTTVARLSGGSVQVSEFDARTLGLTVPSRDALHAADSEASARIIREVLAGKMGPARDIVLVNAAAATLVAAKANDWSAGMTLAAHSIDEGRAADALKKLVAATNQ